MHIFLDFIRHPIHCVYPALLPNPNPSVSLIHVKLLIFFSFSSRWNFTPPSMAVECYSMHIYIPLQNILCGVFSWLTSHVRWNGVHNINNVKSPVMQANQKLQFMVNTCVCTKIVFLLKESWKNFIFSAYHSF